ncbi:hypothetical protein M422DRAFT_169110 [Sphaerobolus stellatus SS14]|uniref:Uncharacterized protein n=1 Tax=Sphaerobolus stellatus (strain SS14) TaxID=990650 RepID=A0A0C9VZP8_SPHS4|nr:hypothetical protein M422DRAFT_169110 [Sphaerobolus stellatus SS14]
MRLLFRLFSGPRARQLVGPPHPISHIRPVLYDTASRMGNDQSHPYSLMEFSEGWEDHGNLQLRMEQERLYLFNHTFWLDSNTRFLQGKEEALQRWEANGDKSPESKEVVLSEFYSQWSIQEASRQAKYTKEWNKRNRLVIKLAMGHQIRLWKESLTKALLGQ